MSEKYPKEYEIEVEYDVTTVERNFHIVTVEAFDEDEAIEKAKDKIYDYAPVDDDDYIEFINFDIQKETSTEPGHRDDKTRDMFKKEE